MLFIGHMSLCTLCGGIDFRRMLCPEPDSPEYEPVDLGNLVEVTARAADCRLCSFLLGIIHNGGLLVLDFWKVIHDGQNSRYERVEQRDPTRLRINVSRGKPISRSASPQFPYGEHRSVYWACITVHYPTGWPREAMRRAFQISRVSFPLGTTSKAWAKEVKPIADLSRVRGWFRTCSEAHEQCRSSRWLSATSKPRQYRLIDVVDRCLVDGDDETTYVALSYVWGKTDTLTLSVGNQHTLREPQGLESRSERNACAVKDAMVVCRRLEVRYLWVDRVCIVQDDEDDLRYQVGQMERIYSHAIFTIILQSGSHADERIPGLDIERPGFPPPRCDVNGDVSLSASPRMPNMLYVYRPWTKRGWTLQEYVLSRRCLHIGENSQFYWECQEATWTEELDIDGYTHAQLGCINSGPECGFTDALPIRREAPAPIADPRGRRQAYFDILEVYSARTVSYQKDIFKGVSGILRAIGGNTGQEPDRFLFGLPESCFSSALDWHFSNSHENYGLKRDLPLKEQHWAEDDMDFVRSIPTWTWAAWKYQSVKFGFELDEKDRVRGGTLKELSWYSATTCRRVRPVHESVLGQREDFDLDLDDKLKYRELASLWKGQDGPLDLETVNEGHDQSCKGCTDTGLLYVWTSCTRGHITNPPFGDGHLRIYNDHGEMIGFGNVWLLHAFKHKQIIVTTETIAESAIPIKLQQVLLKSAPEGDRSSIRVVLDVEIIVTARRRRIGGESLGQLCVMVVETDNAGVAHKKVSAYVDEKMWISLKPEWKLVVLG